MVFYCLFYFFLEKKTGSAAFCVVAHVEDVVAPRSSACVLPEPETQPAEVQPGENPAVQPQEHELSVAEEVQPEIPDEQPLEQPLEQTLKPSLAAAVQQENTAVQPQEHDLSVAQEVQTQVPIVQSSDLSRKLYIASVLTKSATWPFMILINLATGPRFSLGLCNLASATWPLQLGLL